MLNCLAAGVGSVVDQKVAMEHENDGDFGYEWLKTNSAASGPFALLGWKPNESVTLEARDFALRQAGDGAGDHPPRARARRAAPPDRPRRHQELAYPCGALPGGLSQLVEQRLSFPQVEFPPARGTPREACHGIDKEQADA